jgi:hypothetical protein
MSGAAALVVLLGITNGAPAQQSGMSFFVTSAGSGTGADLGGLAGADRQCQPAARPICAAPVATACSTV